MVQKKSQYRAYSAATNTVAKTRQIVMLYDGAIRFIRQAQVAIDENRIEDRFNLLKRASDVMMGLQNCIDFEKGGKMAHTLQGFYVNISNRILSINFERKNGRALCETIISEVKQMRDVWDHIDQTMTAENGPEPLPQPAPPKSAMPLGGMESKNTFTVSA